MNQKLNILIAPLDWGLGHTTRCIPIINSLLSYATVTVACNQQQQQLLQAEFPQLQFLSLKGYHIRYAGSKKWFAFKILLQIPKIISAVYTERKWLKKVASVHHFDIIISDNRYGFHHPNIPSVFITHQLCIQAPFVWIEQLLQRINYAFIQRFDACWVPDFANENSIAGKLSNPVKLPHLPLHYIGMLSRFTPAAKSAVKWDWLFLVSGPEPQRSLLEEKIRRIEKHLPGKKLLVCGKPAEAFQETTTTGMEVISHLKGELLQKELLSSAKVVCRAGYTSVMELVSLQIPAVLIPTPGQSEQEYLGRYLNTKKWFGLAFQDAADSVFVEQLMQSQNIPPAVVSTTDFSEMIRQLCEELILQKKQ